MKRFSLVVLLCSLFVSFALANNAPIQDVYHFDIREGIGGLSTLEYVAPLLSAPGQPSETVTRNVGQKLVDLIELIVAYDKDPSVALGNPDAGISNFGLADSGVYWNATAGITQFELAVMAVKILGGEEMALRMYPLVTPTFSDVDANGNLVNYQAGKTSLFYNRAYGYVEYYNNFLREEYPCLMPVPFDTVLGNDPYPHNKQATRLDVIEFAVRLAQAKFSKEDYNLNDVSAYVPAALATAMNFDTAENKSIVAFAEALNKHLTASPYTWNTAVDKVGFLYAFEFFFLSKVDAKEVSAEKYTANEFVSLEEPLNVPILLLDEFRVYATGNNTFGFLGRFNPTRNVWQNANGDILIAERFWTVALFSKLFNTTVSKVPQGAYVPKRELNNVVVYEKTGETFKGQLVFGDVEYEKGMTTELKTEYKCQNEAYPTYLDPDGNSNTPKLEYFVYELEDGSMVVLTDMTIWDKDGITGSTNGKDFFDYNPAVAGEESRTYSAYGIFDKANGRLVGTKILDSRNTAPTAEEKALFPCEVALNEETIASYMVFIPTVADFTGNMDNVLTKSVQEILQSPATADARFVKAQNALTVNNLVNAEPVMFDVTFARGAGEPDEVKFLYAKDRLNHKDEILTLGGIKTFIEMYTGDKVLDRIDPLSADGYADQPMLAYYIHMYNTLNKAGVPDEAKFVAVVKSQEQPEPALSDPTYAGFRIAEQLYGQVNGLERYDPTTVMPLKEAYTADGGIIVRPVAPVESEHEVYPVITDACVTRPDIDEDVYECPALPELETGKSSVQNCCLYPVVDGDYIVSFDPYVQYDFVFPATARIAAFDSNMVQTAVATLEDSPELLLEKHFGFFGPKVKGLFVSRSINPEKPTLDADNTMLIKTYVK